MLAGVWLLGAVKSSPEAAGRAGSARSLGFEKGLQGWRLRPGETAQTSLTPRDKRGTVLTLEARGCLLGVETDPLILGRDLAEGVAYRVTAWVKKDGLKKGVFSFSAYCFDNHGKTLKQFVFAAMSPAAKPRGWRRVRGAFGPGTTHPLPPGTTSLCLRFSFFARDHDCRGRVAVNHVTLESYHPPLPPGWPTEIIARVGELGIRFESRSFWTLYRIDYQGDRLCLDRFGSHYGSVASFPGVGFVGSGHTENGEEQVLEVKLFVDGKALTIPPREVTCSRLRLWKQSRIRTLLLTTQITVGDDRVEEEVRLRAEKATPVDLVYHFMHPWTPSATEYLAELLDGTRVEGRFTGDRKQKIDKPTRWSALYDPSNRKGAVTYVLAAPKDDWRTRYWDVPGVYRKHYFTTFLAKTIPAHKEFLYRVVTEPFAAPAETWKEAAAHVAGVLKTLAAR